MSAPKACMEIWPPVLSLGGLDQLILEPPKRVGKTGLNAYECIVLDASGFEYGELPLPGQCFNFFIFLEIGFRNFDLAPPWGFRGHGSEVEIDRRMVDFIVGLDSEMQQLVEARKRSPVGPLLFICIREQSFYVSLSFIAHDMTRIGQIYLTTAQDGSHLYLPQSLVGLGAGG